MNKKRLDYLDYAKAFAILMVVLLHIGLSEVRNYFLFAMPLFFVTAGYTYVPGKRTLSLVGRNTMVIYCWHMLFQFIFDVLYLKIFDTPAYPDQFYMAILPPNAWWYMILEAVAIIFVCILLGKLKEKHKLFF